VDLEGVADELYGLPLASFIPTRGERAKQARAAGQRDLAAEIGRLVKPTKVAWLVNQLVRQRPEEVEPLLALGAGLREATATLSGDDLRRLTRQQHQLVQAMVALARGIAADAGEAVSSDVADGVDQTLRAALADDGLATALSGGRLTDRLAFAGFGGGSAGVDELAARRRTPPRTPVATDQAAEQRRARREEAERAAVDARAAVTSAQADRDAAVREADRAAEESVRLAERLAELRAEADQVGADQAAAAVVVKAARTALEQAERKLRAADRRATAADAERAALDTDPRR